MDDCLVYNTHSSTQKNTVLCPDDGPIAAGNMRRLTNINVLGKNCAPGWFIYRVITDI
jgi:hypothetical protein